MRGLIQKDLCILRQRMTTVYMFIAIMLMMCFSVGGMFAVCYGSMLFGFLAQSTIAYDDDGNCMTYLMTLPITIRDYVREKLLFSGIALAFGWAVSIVMTLAMNLVKQDLQFDGSEMLQMLITLFIFAAILSVYIPIQLKFGTEKSRYVVLAIGAGVFILGTLLGKLNVPMPAAMQGLADTPEVTITVVVLVVCSIAIAAAYFWSIKILEKREF